LACIVLAGCIGPPNPATPLVEVPPCIAGGPLLIEVQSVLTGGARNSTFFVDDGCRLDISFELRELIGTLDIDVEGPAGAIVDVYRMGVTVAGINEALPPESRLRIEEGPAPQGTYHYRFAADKRADFSLLISAGP
jgi:hypothetical protein